MVLRSVLSWRTCGLFAIAIMVLATVTGIQAAEGVQSNPSPHNAYTPLVVSALTPKTDAVLGVDGQYHVVYELELSNAGRTRATLNTIEVFDVSTPSRVIKTFEGEDLLNRLRPLSNRKPDEPRSPDIEPSGTRLFLIDLTFESATDLPSRLLHRVSLLGGTSPASSSAAQFNYTAAPLTIHPQPPVFGPPLAGKGWIAINGCCGLDVGHRSTGLPINSELSFAQRFAIDWMKMDENGRVLNGDVKDVNNFPSYGAEVLAIADGTVLATRNDLPDQVPGALPKNTTLENLLGNHVILQLDDSKVFALYGHLQKDSVTVKLGDKVKRGKVLGKLGNTGNSSGPHLHLHLMSGPSLGSNGLPYVIDRFDVAGQIPAQPPEVRKAFYDFEGDWSKYRQEPSSRDNQFPLHFTIVDFPD